MRHLGLVLALAVAVLAACTPPQTTEAPPAAVAETGERDIIVAVLTGALAGDLGAPVQLRVDTLKTEGDWAWVVALPQAAGGAPFDFSKTKYAEDAAEGVLDGGGVTYALLQRQNGVWIVRDFAVGPTDVAWAPWPAQYGAPASLMGLPETPPAP